MAIFDTYMQLRQSEDVVDEIYIVSPVDNPCASLSKTVRATGRYHEWTEDKLRASAKNARPEGATARAAAHNPVTEKGAYCQIMDGVAEVSGTLEVVDKYGRNSEMAYQLELEYGALANDEESAIMGAPGGTRQTGAAGATGTGRELTSFHNQLAAGVIVDAALTTTVLDLEADLVAAHMACYKLGGRPSILFTNPDNSLYIADFARSTARNRDIRNETKIVNVVDRYASQFGEMDVILDREQDDCFIGFDPNYAATPVLRATHDKPLPEDGDFHRRLVLRESTFAVLNSEAHFMVDNIQAGLTLT